MIRARGRLAAWLALAACGGSHEAPAPAPAAADPRVRELLDACASVSRYEKDTSWITPILVDKLVSGEPLPIRRAQEELALLGDEAMEALQRLVARHYADAQAAAVLENAMGAAGRCASPLARSVLLAGFEHPQEVVRSAALAGLLAGHVLPEDYELLLAHLEGPEPATMRAEIVRGLFAADGARAAQLALGWIAAGERRGEWIAAAPLLLGLDAPPARERCPGEAELAALLPDVRAAVAACCARAGDAGAADVLRAALADPDPALRVLALRAAAAIGWQDEVAALARDRSPLVRAATVAALGAGEVGERGRAVLHAALDDEASEVRTAALERLAERDDPAALDRALAEIEASPERGLLALRATRAALERSASLAARALAALAARDRREAHRPLGERLTTFKSVGLVPGAPSARWLRALALEHAEETIQGLAAHRWLTIQAGNTGVDGRAWLAAELAGERDRARRIDLIDAVGSVPDGLGRETLLEVLRADEVGEEALFAAGRLVHLGPAGLVATRVKRAALTVADGDARRGLYCLLWRWY